MITVPLLLPIGIALGIDPIHLGVIMVVNMEIGMITPPVGLNLFVASGITGLSLKEIIVSIFTNNWNTSNRTNACNIYSSYFTMASKLNVWILGKTLKYKLIDFMGIFSHKIRL